MVLLIYPKKGANPHTFCIDYSRKLIPNDKEVNKMNAQPLTINRYMIQAGDTIKSIATQFDTTPVELMKLNGNKPLIIQPKQFINVPLLENNRTHVIAEGETLQDLLIRYKLTPDELVHLNQDLFLQAGQMVTIQH